MDVNNNTSLSEMKKFSERTLATSSVVREEFLEYHRENPDQFYEDDIEMVQKDQWWTVRFVKANNHKVDKSVKHMIDVFQWRKTFGVRDRTIGDLPIEFVNSAAVFPLKHDNQGRAVIYIRVRVYRKIQELSDFFRQYFVGVIDHIDQKAGPKGFVLVYDFTGFGLVNMDLDILYFLFTLLHQYYPRGLHYTLVCNLPRFCRPVWNTFKLCLGKNAKFFEFCDKEELKQNIPIENLPRYLGGESNFDFTKYVEDHDVSVCRSVHELGADHGFEPDQVKRLEKLFEPTLLEARTLVQDLQ